MPINTSYIKRHCPICNNNDEVIPHSVVSKIKAEDLLFNELVNYWTGLFKERIFFSYSRCMNCDLLFVPTYFSSEQLVELCSKIPETMSTILKDKALVRTQKGYYETFRKYSSLSGDYLEVGPDEGLFVSSCVKNGRFKKFYIYESNKLVWKSLEGKLRGIDYYLSGEMFDLQVVPDKSISSSVFIHVLDHLVDPVKTLKRLRTKLKKKGIVAIVTHDESSPLAKLMSNRWPTYCLQHPQLFNRDSIKRMLQKTGYKILTIKKTINYYPPGFILKNILWALNIKNVHVPAYDKYNIPMKLGNTITIATPDGA